MHVKHFPVLYFYHCSFNFISDLQNVWTWNTTSLIKKTITFEKALMSIFRRSHLVHICKLRKLCWKGDVIIFKAWWFVLKVPDNPFRFFMHHLHEAWKKNIIVKWRLKINKLINMKVHTHFCFFLPSNWSCSKYTHFRLNKFLHGSFELIIDSCNSREAELSIADMRSSVPSVINNSERLNKGRI